MWEEFGDSLWVHWLSCGRLVMMEGCSVIIVVSSASFLWDNRDAQ